MLDPAGVREALERDLAVEVLAACGQLRLTAQGASMIPAVWPGDTLLVQRADAGQVSPGDIVLCRWAGGLRAHRLRAKAGSGDDTSLVTRGDAMSENDPPVPAIDLLGRVSAVVSGQNYRLPRPRLSLGERVIALLARRSARATRLLLRARSVAAALPAGRGACLP